MSDFDEDIPDLPPLPGVSDEAGGMKPGSEAAAAGISVHDHLVMADEGYHHHDHLHEDSDGLHLGGEAKIDSVEAAIMAVANAGRPPTSPITRSRAGQNKKQRSRCSMEGCDKQVSMCMYELLIFRFIWQYILINLLARNFADGIYLFIHSFIYPTCKPFISNHQHDTNILPNTVSGS